MSAFRHSEGFLFLSIVFLVWQVESVSYHETAGSTENRTPEGAERHEVSGVELKRFSRAVSDTDLWHVDEYNELPEMKNNRSELKSNTGGDTSQEDNYPDEAL